jgi:hypothetical protein
MGMNKEPSSELLRRMSETPEEQSAIMPPIYYLIQGLFWNVLKHSVSDAHQRSGF